MSFSQECFVKMANGSTKNINHVNYGDYILNMFSIPKKVSSVIVTNNTSSYEIILSNNTAGIFYINPNKNVRNLIQTHGNNILSWNTFNNVFSNDAKLKGDPLLISNNTVSIVNLISNSTPRNLYDLKLENSIQDSYYINNVIVQSD